MLREYLILSRGGQGGVTASRILAHAAAIEGKYSQAMPEFGAERRGAIVRSYLRISDKPIRVHSVVKRADAVAVFSSKVLNLVDVAKYCKEGAAVIVNSATERRVSTFKTYVINATKIATDLGLVVAGWPVVNTAMAGAMARVLEICSLDTLLTVMENYFSGKILELNREAAKLAWSSVREVG
ncbi:MAG: pyruvate oxidoreductase subunit gamma [Thermoprotei archaeon]|nr:MAG: pyruvate oxidoreductase subunit gamma [Thermoprotei archaeon]